MRSYLAVLILFIIVVLLVVLPKAMLRQAFGTLHTTPQGTAEDVAQLRTRYEAAQALINAYPPATFNALHEKGSVVPVYAYYPFNYQHELLVGGGADKGFAVGDVAVLDGAEGSASRTLVGRVVGVYKNTARVRTIFDPSWRSAVRVGTSSVDALLEGGVTPHLTLIAKNASVAQGDTVYNSDQQFPYGLALGTAGTGVEAQGGVFKQSALQVSYDVNTLRSITILSHAQ